MRFALLALLAATLNAQVYYSVTKSSSLSGSAEVITVQQPATGAVFVQFAAFYADCSVACTITLERNGTAATTTTLAVNKLNPSSAAAAATAFSSSNAGVGTVLGTYSLGAGGNTVVDLSKITFPPTNGTSNNLTIRTSSISGIVNITLQLSEVKN